MRTLLELIFVGLTATPLFALEITTDTVWTGLHSVSGDVLVRPGATLRVGGGTTVSLAPDASLFVFGRLAADGSASAPIHFTRAGHHNGIGRWGKIELTSATGENRFRHCVFHYGNGLRPTSGASGVVSRIAPFTISWATAPTSPKEAPRRCDGATSAQAERKFPARAAARA